MSCHASGFLSFLHSAEPAAHLDVPTVHTHNLKSANQKYNNPPTNPQVNLKLFAPDPSRKRTVLLFVIRDKTKTPMTKLIEVNIMQTASDSRQ